MELATSIHGNPYTFPSSVEMVDCELIKEDQFGKHPVIHDIHDVSILLNLYELYHTFEGYGYDIYDRLYQRVAFDIKDEPQKLDISMGRRTPINSLNDSSRLLPAAISEAHVGTNCASCCCII